MMRILALLGLVGAVAAQKTNTFAVCTAAYEGASSGSDGYISGAVDLFACDSNNQSTGSKIGTYSYNCGDVNKQTVPSPSFQHCSNLWTIGDCIISQIGDIKVSDFTPINAGTWAVGPHSSATKECPKASAYQGYAFSKKDAGSNKAWEKYVFTIKGSANRIPLGATKGH